MAHRYVKLKVLARVTVGVSCCYVRETNWGLAWLMVKGGLGLDRGQPRQRTRARLHSGAPACLKGGLHRNEATGGAWREYHPRFAPSRAYAAHCSVMALLSMAPSL